MNKFAFTQASNDAPLLMPVTESVLPVNTLAHREQRFRSFVDNSSDIFFELTAGGSLSYVSPQWQTALGHPLQETLGQSFQAFVHPEDSAACQACFQQALLSREKSSDLAFRLRCQDGSYKDHMGSVWRVLAPVEATWVLAGAVKERPQAAKLDEGLILARQIFETAFEAIFVCDLEGNLLEVNAEACRLAKYSREDMLRLRNVDIVAQEEVPRIDSELDVADAGGVNENRWLLLCSDGSTVPLDLVVQRLPGDRYLAIGRNLTEREKIQKELAQARDAAEAANLTKSRFLAAVSHDLRQPIQAISLFQEALRLTGLNDRQKNINDNLALAIQSLGGMLHALLDLSRLDAGAVTPVPEVRACRTLLHALDREFWPLAQAKSLQLRFCYTRGPASMLVDPRLFQSMLGNLVGNAIKYTERGGVLICLRRRGGHALIQVWDTGIGIAPSKIEAIFEEYRQIGNHERDRSKGLGLGLSIVRRLSRLLGTEVVCRSRPGRGSVFEFSLPLVNTPPATAHTQVMRATPLTSPLPSGRIIVLEDDGMVSQALALNLTALGMRVTTFSSAEAALASADIHDAYCYISDFRLPGINGLEFLETLQQRSSTPIKAVILSGDASPNQIKLNPATSWTVLLKPVELEQLLAAIEAQVSMSASH
ncbi:MAG: Hybrid sensor histidine kinase [Comamonadaceae bacterium]|nr:MAG: Hybrid sensor histidine kinase [Comamonadaceae bacterium]